MTVTFSNPRLRAEFADWPSGRDRVRCVFQVHHDKRGWRVSRTTTGKPKFTTYAGPAVIVDGSDGRTYILMHIPQSGAVRIVSYDLMHDAGEGDIGRRGYVYSDREDAGLFKELLALIVQGGALTLSLTQGV